MDGLVGKLREIDPDIVQAGELPSLQTYRAALAKPVLGYKLFAECHIHASVFPAATGRGGRRAKVFWPIYYNTTGRLLNWAVERCFAISEDSADIVNRFFGISGERVEVRSLGVDTDLFRPFEGNADLTRKRQELRHRLGFRDDEVVAVYSGRLNIEKDPIFLAQAVEKLQRQGQPFRALFVGDGPREYLDSIRKCAGCVVHSFVPVQELPDLYRAADVGVWPKQESTSQLDAAACGLPLILSNQVKVLERVDGNGLLFEQGDPDSLATQLASLASADRRQKMGALGAKRMREQFSWDKIAMQYEQDYLRALH